MAADKQRDMLQTIFSFFLGLMILAFIGVGVNTFLPEPYQRHSNEQEELFEQQMRIDRTRGKDGELAPAQQAEYDRIQDRIDELNDRIEAERKVWARDTSIVLIAFATLVMAISLVRSEQLKLLSNGLLLGGLFTMIYGTGWSIFSGDDYVRFGVIAAALLVSVALGYLKFVRGRKAAPVAAGGATPPSAELATLEARLAELERRATAAAEALGAGRSEDAGR